MFADVVPRNVRAALLSNKIDGASPEKRRCGKLCLANLACRRFRSEVYALRPSCPLVTCGPGSQSTVHSTHLPDKAVRTPLSEEPGLLPLMRLSEAFGRAAAPKARGSLLRPASPHRPLPHRCDRTRTPCLPAFGREDPPSQLPDR